MARRAVAPAPSPHLHQPSKGPALKPWPHRLSAALMLPREHGAWAMLLMPYLVGTAAAGWGGGASLLLLASILLVFCSSRPLELALQETHGLPELLSRRSHALMRLAAYLGLGGAAGLLLLAYYERWFLMVIGLAAVLALGLQLGLRRRKLERTWPARLLSIAALSAAGPAAYYTASGALDRYALAVGLLTFLYSGASVFYVRLYYRPPAKERRSEAESRACAEAHLNRYLATVAVAVVGLSLFGWLPPLAVGVFVPLAAKVFLASRRGDRRPTLKQIGVAEIGHTTLFALLAAAAVSTWR